MSIWHGAPEFLQVDMWGPLDIHVQLRLLLTVLDQETYDYSYYLRIY